MKMKLSNRFLKSLAAVSVLALAGVGNPGPAHASSPSPEPSSGSSERASDSSGGGPRSSEGAPGSLKGDPNVSKGAHASSDSVPGSSNNVPKNLERFYRQKLRWSECKGKDRAGMQCAQAQVPLDYKKPGGKTITISMLKVPAKGGKPTGSLFVNPGGPGGSGIEKAASLSKSLKPEILDKYDVVGFDPRGVDASTPVKCADAAALNTFIFDADYDLSTAKDRQQQQEEAKKIADGCEKRSGELLAHVGTESAARDMDVLRGLVGDKKLNYLGFSYGTELGGMYADLFPKKVGRMVLDGAVDTQLGNARMLYEGALSVDESFGRYVKRCVDGGKCPLGATVKAAKKKMRTLFDQAAKKPFPTSNPARPLTRSNLMMAVRFAMYRDEAWPGLDQALGKLIEKNDGTELLELAGPQTPNDESNMIESLLAISCADYAKEPESVYAKYNKKLKERASIFGGYDPWTTKMIQVCNNLKYHPKAGPGAFRAKGSAPIVVIGTRHDPATPYHWAKAMRRTLQNSVLLTWEGDGHLAYGRAGACIEDQVNAYLLTGRVPKDGLVCPVERRR